MWNIKKIALILLSLCVWSFGQTPDGETPAEEETCSKYQGEGARHGLCVAYCEAQDCDGEGAGSNSCVRIEDKFIEYSVKKGYEPFPGPGAIITCQTSACSAEDIACGGREIDCREDGQCVAICSVVAGIDGKGNPACINQPCRACQNDATGP